MAAEFGGRILDKEEEGNVNDALFFVGLSMLQGAAAYRFLMLGASPVLTSFVGEFLQCILGL